MSSLLEYFAAGVKKLYRFGEKTRTNLLSAKPLYQAFGDDIS